MLKKINFLDQETSRVFKLLFESIDKERLLEVPLSAADYIFYSPFTPDHHFVGPNVIKIFITGENLCPDFNACDYAISGEHLELGDRHLRVPTYATYEDAKKLSSRPKINEAELSAKSEFCNFVYSNNHRADPTREQFFNAISAVSPIVSAGRFLRNSDALIALETDNNWKVAKQKFLQQFRFTIAMEASGKPGYVTEKLMDALIAKTVPIFWGDPRITEEFNADAFFHLRDYKNYSEAIYDIKQLDADRPRLLEMINAPVFTGGTDRVDRYLRAAQNFIEAIFDQNLTAARRRPRDGWTQWLEQKRRKDQTGLTRRLKRNRF